MRKFKIGLAVLATSAAVLAPAGIAAANPQDGLVNVYATDILSGNQIVVLQNVAIPVAASFCAVNANVLSTQLANTQTGTCPATSTSWQHAWVGWS